jgi:hypothetical protein
MSDPRYTDPRFSEPVDRQSDYASSNAMWGWVAGIVVLAVIVSLLVFGGQTGNQQTASPGASRPATTGQNLPPPMRNNLNRTRLRLRPLRRHLLRRLRRPRRRRAKRTA